jgi:hypothetical protein
VVTHKLFDIDEVSGYLTHRLGQIGLVDELVCLPSQVRDVIFSKSAVDYVAMLVHGRHILLDVR